MDRTGRAGFSTDHCRRDGTVSISSDAHGTAQQRTFGCGETGLVGSDAGSATLGALDGNGVSTAMWWTLIFPRAIHHKL